MSTRALSITTALLFSIGCAGKQAAPPQIPREADVAVREQVYADHRLDFRTGFWTHRWRRADGSYHLNAVAPAAGAYPESAASHRRAKTRALVTTIFAASGGGIIGYALGTQLGASAESAPSGTALAALYGTGAVLVIIGIVLDQTWAKAAYRDLAETYNGALRRDLALPPE